MNRFILVVSIILWANLTSFSQGLAENFNFKISPKLEIGGGLGGSFNNSQLEIGISPVLGIHLTSFLYLGLGINYQYYNNFSVSNTSMHTVGGNLLSRLLVIKGFYVQAQAGRMFYITDDEYYRNGNNHDDELMLGVGYQQAISANLNAYFTILWNFIENPYNATSNPVIQAGVGYLF